MDDSGSAFEGQARVYCALVEDPSPANSWIFAEKCLHSVLRLHELALHLPNTDPGGCTWLDQVTTDEWKAVENRIGNRLHRDFYWHVFQPLEKEPPQPSLGSLADDLADIWREIKSGLLDLDGDPALSRPEVVWHWRYSFEIHWNWHAAGAICGLNALCYGEFADPARPMPSPVESEPD